MTIKKIDSFMGFLMASESPARIPSIGVSLHKILNLNIFKQVTANPTSCCGLHIIYGAPYTVQQIETYGK